jgi:hypothetical protein
MRFYNDKLIEELKKCKLIKLPKDAINIVINGREVNLPDVLISCNYVRADRICYSKF